VQKNTQGQAGRLRTAKHCDQSDSEEARFLLATALQLAVLVVAALNIQPSCHDRSRTTMRVASSADNSQSRVTEFL